MSQNYYPPKMQKLWQQIESTTKHRMFGYKFYPNTENFTPSRMVWMVTFCKSATTNSFQLAYPPLFWQFASQASKGILITMTGTFWHLYLEVIFTLVFLKTLFMLCLEDVKCHFTDSPGWQQDSGIKGQYIVCLFYIQVLKTSQKTSQLPFYHPPNFFLNLFNNLVC